MINPTQGWKIDLKKASADALRLIPGLGPSRVAALLSYRSTHGEFQSWKDLEEVPGIGPSTVQEIKKWATLDSSTAGTLGYNPEDAKN